MQTLRFPIIISILLHLAVGALLFMHFKSKPQTAPSVNIVQAVAIQENQLKAASSAPAASAIPQKPSVLPQQDIRQIEQSALHQKELPKEFPKEKPVEIKSLPEPEPPPTPPTKVVHELAEPEIKIDSKAAQLAAKQAAMQEKMQAEAKRKQAIKSHEEDLAKQRREEETKQLTKELGIETKSKTTTEMPVPESSAPAENAEEGLEAQLGAEKKSLESKMSAANQAGEVDKYKQMIIQSISRKWLMPEIEDKSLACQLLVHLGPGGVVIDVEVTKASGDENLDRSASNAIMKASPLPVPEKSELFDNFRALRLTFRPQGIISS